MRVYEITERTPECLAELLAVWERSVRTTHTFLSETYGLEHYAIREVTVNEQNPAALGFYRHFGFREYRRTETDEEGGPYPLLYLRREG